MLGIDLWLAVHLAMRDVDDSMNSVDESKRCCRVKVLGTAGANMTKATTTLLPAIRRPPTLSRFDREPDLLPFYNINSSLVLFSCNSHAHHPPT
jgi:hypothetical protein